MTDGKHSRIQIPRVKRTEVEQQYQYSENKPRLQHIAVVMIREGDRRRQTAGNLIPRVKRN